MLQSFLFSTCNGMNKETISRISKLENILDVMATTGDYDIVTVIKTGDFKELKDILKNKIDRIIDIESSLILCTEDKNEPESVMKNYERYTDCDYCGLSLPHCHCRCPYCGERDKCECALFDAATGG